MTCKYWTGSFSTFTQGVRNVTYNIFQALWPRHLVGEYPTLDQLYQHMWNQTDLDLAALKPEECAAGAEVDGTKPWSWWGLGATAPTCFGASSTS